MAPEPIFVVQKHAASTLHYHSLGYADFEGTIGEGYGAGAVIVWDTDARRNPVSTQPESVLSGRTIEQVAEGD